MLPSIGIFDTYSVLLIIGILLCFVYLHIFYARHKKNKIVLYVVEIQALISIIVGIIFAILFENLYELIKYKDQYTWTWAMTFYGGLIGGAITFILTYFFFKKKYGNYIKDVLIIAPSCICIAHGLGRVGCFCAGCCYGIETTSWIGVKFPGMENKVIPTNLIEAIFLIILSIALLIFALKLDLKYNFPIYLIAYGIFRFIIEFYRGDERGQLLNTLSPSQFISIGIILSGIIYAIYLFIKNKKQLKKSQ